MATRGRRGPRTRGGRSTSYTTTSPVGHTTSPTSLMTLTTDLLSLVSTYPPRFFAAPPSQPLFHATYSTGASFQSVPLPGVPYLFGQPAGRSFHSLPLVIYSQQPVLALGPSLQKISPHGTSGMMMINTLSMRPQYIPSASTSTSSNVTSASLFTCPSMSSPSGTGSPVLETQHSSTQSVTTTACKGKKKKHTSATVALSRGVGSKDQSDRLIIMPARDGTSVHGMGNIMTLPRGILKGNQRKGLVMGSQNSEDLEQFLVGFILKIGKSQNILGVSRIHSPE